MEAFQDAGNKPTHGPAHTPTHVAAHTQTHLPAHTPTHGPTHTPTHGPTHPTVRLNSEINSPRTIRGNFYDFQSPRNYLDIT